MKNLGILSLFIFFLLSCEDSIDGYLNLSTPQVFKVYANPLSCKKDSCASFTEIKLPAGKYRSQILFKSSTEALLVIKENSESFHYAKIVIPKNENLNIENGNFEIKSSESGQPFNLEGEVNSDKSLSPTKSITEICSYNCSTDQPSSYCLKSDDRIDGERNVDFFFSTKVKTYQIRLKNLNHFMTGKFISIFKEKTKVYSYEGPCRIKK